MPRRGARSERGGAGPQRSAGEVGRGAGPRPATGRAAGPGLLPGKGRVESEGCGPRAAGEALRRLGVRVVTGQGCRTPGI